MSENCCKYREGTLGSYLDGYVPEKFWVGIFDDQQTENVVKVGELVFDAYYMARAELKMSKEEAIALRSIILLGPVMEWAAEATKGYKEALQNTKATTYRQCARVAPLPNGVPFSFRPTQVCRPH